MAAFSPTANATAIEGYWLKYTNEKTNSDKIIYAQKYDRDNSLLDNVIILVFDDEGKFILRVDAKLATVKDDTMTFDSSARITPIGMPSFDGSKTKLSISEEYILNNIRPIRKVTFFESLINYYFGTESIHKYLFHPGYFIAIADDMYIYAEKTLEGGGYKNVIFMDNRDSDRKFINIASKITFEEKKESSFLILEKGIVQSHDKTLDEIFFLKYELNRVKLSSIAKGLTIK